MVQAMFALSEILEHRGSVEFGPYFPLGQHFLQPGKVSNERYSISDVQHIVSYANQRGIDVVMVRFISNRPMHHTKYLYIGRNSIALDTRLESPLRIPNTSLVQTSRRGLSTRTNRPPDSFA